ncbi:MAG: hypothetical protein KDC27_19085, partial [Acidobacteria bacterium]|nr:hypothetical protein [Acidobacteriota bacterium]
LYRSGFIEDDQRALGVETSPALLAPLRAPGKPAPGWDLVPLTFSWALDRRPEYFDRDVLPAIEDAAVFYYFSCDCASGAPSAGYEQRFAKWVDERFPGRYERKAIEAGRGMVAIRFEARESAAVLRPEPRVVGQTPNMPAEVR